MVSRSNAQGAMEYLMTYGWAILVVMIVGIAMWQLGIFNIGGTTATTSTGFSRLKPLLTAIHYGPYSNPSYDELEITFVNGAGSAITFGDDCTSTGDQTGNYDWEMYCRYSIKVGPGGWFCMIPKLSKCSSPNFYDDNDWYQYIDPDLGYQPAAIKSGETFCIYCATMDTQRGSSYFINITLKYRVSIAGRTMERSDTGTIRGPIEK